MAIAAPARHAAGRPDEVWKSADRAIFADFRDRIPLDFYKAMFFSEDSVFVSRAAFLQRACVHARRTDWPAALEDLRAAARALPDTPLGPLEVAICRRAMAGKHGIEEALMPRIREELVAMGRANGAGASIARALACGLVWRARTAIKAQRMASAGRILRLASGLVSTGREGPGTRERRDIPAAAFLTSWHSPVWRGGMRQ